MSAIAMENRCAHRGPLTALDIPNILKALDELRQEVSSPAPTPNWAKLSKWFFGDKPQECPSQQDDWPCRIYVAVAWTSMWMAPSGKYTPSGTIDLADSKLDKSQMKSLTWNCKELTLTHSLWFHIPSNPEYHREFRSKLEECINSLQVNTQNITSGQKANSIAYQQSPARKGKDIDGRMIKMLYSTPESRNWSVKKWAEALDCAKSTIADTNTNTWKNIIMADRCSAKVDRLEKDKTRRG